MQLNSAQESCQERLARQHGSESFKVDKFLGMIACILAATDWT